MDYEEFIGPNRECVGIRVSKKANDLAREAIGYIEAHDREMYMFDLREQERNKLRFFELDRVKNAAARTAAGMLILITAGVVIEEARQMYESFQAAFHLFL